MSSTTETKQALQELSYVMKHDWDDRARHDAKWFINTLRFQQSEEEFDQTGAFEVNRLVLADLPLLTGNRDPKSLRVLEIGCGAGRMTKHLAAVFGEVVGVDVSGEMIVQAQQRLAGTNNAKFYETNGVDFSIFPDQHFDLILSAYVFQHVPSAEVIQSNLEDAWRVLIPGGVIRFQTNAITAFDFEGLEKDTWTGADFPESALRRFAAEKDAQLIAIIGAGSQYCWTTLRKHLRAAHLPANKVQYTTAAPEIVAFGRADDFSIKDIPVCGAYSHLGLIISGLNGEEVDANSLFVEINGQRVLPQYVGPAGQAGFNNPSLKLTQINQQLPAGLQDGQAEIRAVFANGEATQPILIQLYNPPPIVPKIVNVRNEHDEEAASLTRGHNLEIWLYVEGLDLTADPGNTRVKIGERIVKPSHIGFYPANATYLVKAPLTSKVEPGEQELKLYFGNLESPGWQIVIQ